MSRAPLFEDFPPVPTEAWEKQIREDLGDRDYAETLLWHLSDGITVRPYYRAEDIVGVESSDLEPVECPVDWKLRQDIRTPDLETAATHARSALDAGVDVLGVGVGIEHDHCSGVPIFTKGDFGRFFESLPLGDAGLHLSGGVLGPALLALCLDSPGLEVHSLSVQFDPIAESIRTGRRLDHLLDLTAEMIQTVDDERLPEARLLAASSSVFHDAGATHVQETAMVLASMSELLVQMIDRGLRPEDVLRRLIITASVGSSYFVEIARLRALRLLIRQLADVFVPDHVAELPPIHGETSTRNRTLYDPHENLLRSTTEAASAVVGGCDVVAVHPFDDVAGRCDEFSYRMARNIQHILRHEGGFSRVADPAAGSYYVEKLTDAIARRSWQLFQDIESEGGLFEALESGFIHQRLGAAREERRMAFAERRNVLVGTNHYPDFRERRASDVSTREAGGVPLDFDSSKIVHGFDELRDRMGSGARMGAFGSLLDGEQIAQALPRERDAEPIEQRRLRTERLGRDVRILLIPFGDAAARSARANFAANLLGCGGFVIESPIGFDDVAAAARTIRDHAADVVVFCAHDDEYGELLVQVKHQLQEAETTAAERGDATGGTTYGIVAAPEVADRLADRHFDFSIHRGSNLIDVIDDLYRRLESQASREAVR